MRNRRFCSTLSGSSKWPAVADLIAAFLLLFVFLTFYQYFTRYEFWESLVVRSRQGELERQFRLAFPHEMSAGLITISTDGSLQRISYSDALLFDSSSVELRSVKYLDLTATILQRLGQDIFDGIQVEGYTDSDRVIRSSPMHAARCIRDNWDLSSARAVEVVRRLQLELGIRPDLLSATGYSWYRSQSNSTELDKKQNRKIEVVLVYSVRPRVILAKPQAR